MKKNIYILKESEVELISEKLSEALIELKSDDSQSLAYKRVRDVQDRIIEYMLEQNIKV